MVSALGATGAVLAMLLAGALNHMREPLWQLSGLGRTLQPIGGFPYQCRRLDDPRLRACEDMWLSESTRQLFLACSDPERRKAWLPNTGRFNASGRSQTDAVIAMDVDSPRGDSFAYRVLATPGFPGTAGDGRLNLLSVSGVDARDGSGAVKLYLINNKPSVDAATGAILPDAAQAAVGANSTIEVFATGPGMAPAGEMRHVRTYADPLIATPNNVVVIPGESGDGGGDDDEDEMILFTNDHGLSKTGLAWELSIYIGTGDVTLCSPRGGCHRVAGGFRFANGLAASPDGSLLYVPCSLASGIDVFEMPASGARNSNSSSGGNTPLRRVERIPLPYPVDNLSVDGRGDVYAAAFPLLAEASRATVDPDFPARSAIFRIRRLPSPEEGGSRRRQHHVWEKVLEDRDREVLYHMPTTAVHDAKTGRLFLSGVGAKYFVVCDPK